MAILTSSAFILLVFLSGYMLAPVLMDWDARRIAARVVGAQLLMVLAACIACWQLDLDISSSADMQAETAKHSEPDQPTATSPVTG